MRARFRSGVSHEGLTRRVKLGILQMEVPVRDPSLYYESWVAKIYDGLNLRVGDCVLDVGANIGDFTILAAKAVGESGHVVAIEPSPVWLPLLLQNIRLNGLRNVKVISKAVGDSAGPTSVRGAMPGDPHQGGPSDTIQVEGDTIDRLLLDARESRIDCMKMDVEGAELTALKGQVFLQQVRSVAIETHGANCREVVEGVLKQGGFEVRPLTREEIYSNLFTSARVGWFDILRAELAFRFFATRKLIPALTGRGGILITDTQRSDLAVVIGRRVSGCR